MSRLICALTAALLLALVPATAVAQDDTKDVLMVGNVDWIEVWNVGEYRAATESLDEEIGDRSRAMWPDPESKA